MRALRSLASLGSGAVLEDVPKELGLGLNEVVGGGEACVAFVVLALPQE